MESDTQMFRAFHLHRLSGRKQQRPHSLLLLFTSSIFANSRKKRKGWLAGWSSPLFTSLTQGNKLFTSAQPLARCQLTTRTERSRVGSIRSHISLVYFLLISSSLRIKMKYKNNLIETDPTLCICIPFFRTKQIPKYTRTGRVFEMAQFFFF